jgi:hypothetical protein
VTYASLDIPQVLSIGAGALLIAFLDGAPVMYPAQRAASDRLCSSKARAPPTVTTDHLVDWSGAVTAATGRAGGAPGRRPRSRGARSQVLVRVGVLASGTALEDSMVVVRRRRNTTIAVIWSDRRDDVARDQPAAMRPRAGRRERSESRS